MRQWPAREVEVAQHYCQPLVDVVAAAREGGVVLAADGLHGFNYGEEKGHREESGAGGGAEG